LFGLGDTGEILDVGGEELPEAGVAVAMVVEADEARVGML